MIPKTANICGKFFFNCFIFIVYQNVVLTFVDERQHLPNGQLVFLMGLLCRFIMSYQPINFLQILVSKILFLISTFLFENEIHRSYYFLVKQYLFL